MHYSFASIVELTCMTYTGISYCCLFCLLSSFCFVFFIFAYMNMGIGKKEKPRNHMIM